MWLTNPSGTAESTETADWGKEALSNSSLELKPRLRARQNVVFETGLFMGLLGRKKVCVVYEPVVELSSDLEGVARY